MKPARRRNELITRCAVAAAAVAAFILLATQPGGSVDAARAQVEEREPARTAQRASAQTDDEDADGDAATVTLTLLHNNDGESKLLPNVEDGFPGIARFAHTWVEEGRASDADILLRVSSGDNFLASKEFSAGLALDGQPLYDSVALRGLYEAVGLGNHDFDFGPDVTAQFIEGFRLNENSQPVTFVAANVDFSAEPALQALVDEGRLARSTIWTDPQSGLQVGVIGALTPRLANISSPRNVVVDADVAGAVNAEAAALIEQGIDRIVLVSHLQGLSEDQELVPQLSGVDIVVAGGGDELLKNDGDSCQPDDEPFGPYPLLLIDADGNDVAVVTAPGGYRCIGRLDVEFNAAGELVDVVGTSIGVPLDGPSEAFALARVEEPLTAALSELDATEIGTSEVALDGRRAGVRTQATNVGELLADSLLVAGQQAPDFGGVIPVVAIQNGGGIRNDAEISAGTITEADTFDIAPFANFVVTGEVSRERFKELLEVAVSGLPEAQGTFPQIAGFSMQVDAAESARVVDSDGDCSVIDAAGSRVRSVVLDDGTEIVSDGQVVPGEPIGLATIDFLAGGGDCYPLSDIDFVTVGASYQQALRDYIVNDLGGDITADQYPEGGSRIVIDGELAEDSSNDDAATDDGDDGDTGSGDTGSGDTGSGDTDSGDTGSGDTGSGDTDSQDDTGDLPRTGNDAPLHLVVALTVAAGGALVAIEAQRASRLSLTNRLHATRPWIPDSAFSHDNPSENHVVDTQPNDNTREDFGR